MRTLDRIPPVWVGHPGGGAPIDDSHLFLRRAWPREPGHLLLEYRTTDGMVVAGQWFADETRCARIGERTAAAAPAAAVVRSREVLLQPDGADRRLRGLGPLVTTPGATLVAHRPERRAVVRVEAEAGTQFVRVVTPRRFPGVLHAALLVRATGAVATPHLLASHADNGTTVWRALGGAALYDVLAGDGAVDAARRTGSAVAALHAAPVAGPTVHTPAHEWDVVSAWSGHVHAHDPRFGAALAPALTDVQRLLDRLPAAPTAPIHRDLHDKQVFVSDTDVALLDFDTLASGDPALDVANLLVHLELRSLQGRCTTSAADAVASAFLDGYRPDALLTGRLGAYAAATRARLACVYRFRPGAEAVTERLRDGLFDAPVGVSA